MAQLAPPGSQLRMTKQKLQVTVLRHVQVDVTLTWTSTLLE